MTLLCAASHCAIRGRHVAGCAEPACGKPRHDGHCCRGCLPRPACDGLLLCAIDADAIPDNARNAAQLHDDLALVLIRTGRGEHVTGSSSGAPVPDDAVMDARHAIRGTLVALTRLVAAERGFRVPEDTPQAMAGFLARSATRLAAHPAAGEHATDLHRAARDGRRYAYPSGSDRVYLGLCPARYDDGSVCGARLHARAGEPEIECPGCGVKDTVEQWQRWMGVNAADHLGDIAAAGHLSRLLGRPVSPTTIRAWASKGRIAVARDPHNGRVVYRRDEIEIQAARAWPTEHAAAMRSGPPPAAGHVARPA